MLAYPSCDLFQGSVDDKGHVLQHTTTCASEWLAAVLALNKCMLDCWNVTELTVHETHSR
jgi:hypothetical protein